MLSALAKRDVLVVPLIGPGALLAGAAAAAQPKLAIGAVAVLAIAVVSFRAPVAALGLFVFLTCVVPYGIQNRFGVGGGVRSPGLLLSDLLLVGGLARALLTLAYEPLDRRRMRFAALMVAFLAIAALQLVQGVRTGHDLSRAGQEFRAVIGVGALLIAMPLLNDHGARRRLLGVLLGVAVALGAWGMLQWAGHISFGAAGDVGIRNGVRFAAAGTGQLQGGEYGFPVMVVLCFSVLLSGAVRSGPARALLLLGLVLNMASCLVTFERTFWLDAVVGLTFVVLYAPTVPRLRTALFAPLVIVLALGSLSVLAPQEFATAQQRLMSLGQASTDDSLRYRLVESRFVVDRIKARPLIGSGLAATIFWGQPWAQRPPKAYAFSHDGYLWLAWKVGVPAAALLVLLIGSAALARPPSGDDPLTRSVRRGSQGALVGLALATVTFPSLSVLSITPAIGVLMALAICPAPSGGTVRPVRPVGLPRT